MTRSMFHLGIGNAAPWNGRGPTASGMPIYNMTRDQVELDRAGVLRRLPVPPGMTVAFPYIVKIEGWGEYLVQADGTASYYSYKAGRWEPPQVVQNRFDKMFGVE